MYSKKHQKVITEEQALPFVHHQEGKLAKVLVSKKRSFEAASQYSGRKICVLNFASATNPGGGVVRGANAQEEALCRCSTLYSCISDMETAGSFYDSHQQKLRDGQMTSLYNDDCIYTPNITIFKTDTAKPELLPETSWYEADVISCAAPNLRIRTDSQINGSAARAADTGSDDLFEIHQKRIRRVLDIAKLNNAEYMILGAFGCGAFQNPPEIAARAMLDAVRSRLHDFSIIEFAVYCPPYDTMNFDVFKEILAPLCG